MGGEVRRHLAVTVGDGERRRRYAVCFNPREAERRLALEEAELATLSGLADGEQHRKRVCELRAGGRYGRYLRLDPRGRARIDRATVRAAERFDGRFVVHSNDDTLSAEDLAQEGGRWADCLTIVGESAILYMVMEDS